MKFFKHKHKNKGQMMILTTVALGSVFLGATTIAGLLMVYQIRQAGDLTNSSKAIFAADAGIEWALYSNFQGAVQPQPTFTNGTKVAVTCFDASSAPVDCTDPTTARIRSVGTASDGVVRAFELDLN